jgi:hypothetical protein
VTGQGAAGFKLAYPGADGLDPGPSEDHLRWPGLHIIVVRRPWPVGRRRRVPGDAQQHAHPGAAVGWQSS